LSLLPSGQILDVLILCHADDRNQLQNKLPNGADMRYEFADIEELGRKLKIDHRFTDSDARQIFLHQLAASRPKTNYASTEHTRYHTLWQLRLALNLSAGVLLIASVLWSIATMWQSADNGTEAESLQIRAQNTLKEVQLITQSFPSTHAPPADMKAGVAAMRKLHQYAPAPDTILTPISRVLDDLPQIELNDLGWLENAAEPVSSNALAEVPAQIITLNGQLQGFDNDYRAALAYLDRFQLELSARGFQVKILAKPLDVSPNSSLADQRETHENKLGFSLRLAWRPST
jgi:hypothetical protein